jgi:RNA-directed DNA polymerase
MSDVNNTERAPYTSQDWDAINWREARKEVRKLQNRIAKAVREGRYNKAKALQWILTHSHNAKLMAVRIVVTNKGKKTPGVDGVVWRTSKQKIEAVNNLRRHGYRPLPLRRTYIPKKKDNNKKRPLSIPTMSDRAMQALYALALIPVAETTADGNSYGFREKRSCHDAIAQCFISLSRSYSATWILEGDIRACFDEINHNWLLENVLMDKQMLKSWLKAGYIEGSKRFPTKSGTPQGGIISPILANITLDGLEKVIMKAVPRSSKVNLIRYADDFIVTCINREILVDKVIPAIESFLAERGLELSKEKTFITHIDEGLVFLSQNIRKYKGKLLIKPSKEAVKSLVDKVRRIIKSMWGVPPATLIMKLNAVIRGWVNYHKHIVAKKVFSYIDYLLFKMLMRWAKRRHPNKGSRWIWNKYFTNGSYEATFSIKIKTEKKGVYKIFQLYRPAYTPIKRHVKVPQTANPFDPAFDAYFQKRSRWRFDLSRECRQQTIYYSHA